MTITKADLKTKRLKAMAVIGDEMSATDAMYDRVIAAGATVAAARTAAETAQMAAIASQVADLNEVADDLTEMGNAAAPAATVTAAPVSTGAPAGSQQTAALASLMAAQPNPVKAPPPVNAIATFALKDGNAYVGTHGELKG